MFENLREFFKYLSDSAASDTLKASLSTVRLCAVDWTCKRSGSPKSEYCLLLAAYSSCHTTSGKVNPGQVSILFQGNHFKCL